MSEFKGERIMGKVWILFDIGSDELPQVVECFSAKEKAEEYEKHLAHEWPDEYTIEEYELDPECKGERQCVMKPARMKNYRNF
jgi:hypothetical protein